MAELQRWDGDPDDPDDSAVPAVRQPSGAAIDRHRAGGLDLTPEERQARRTNRRVIAGLAISSIVILVLALIATGVATNNEPSGPRLTPPPGFQAINDGYFSYVVPKTWPNDGAFTDSAGDVENSGPTGFAAQHIAFRASPPVLGESPPTALNALGVAHPEPFNLTGGRAVSVKGAAAAFAYTASRPGGFQAAVIDAYDAPRAVEVWLMVEGPPSVTSEVLASLQA